MNKKTHTWSLKDENYLIDELVENWNREDWGDLKKRIANELGTSESSVTAKISNHKYTLGFGGLKHTSSLGDEAIKAAVEKYGFSMNKWKMILE